MSYLISYYVENPQEIIPLLCTILGTIFTILNYFSNTSKKKTNNDLSVLQDIALYLIVSGMIIFLLNIILQDLQTVAIGSIITAFGFLFYGIIEIINPINEKYLKEGFFWVACGLTILAFHYF